MFSRLKSMFSRRRPARERNASYVLPARTPYDLAVDVMNQQTAALLAACGVLETWTGGREMDYDAAVLALEMCGRAVARAEAFPND